MTRLNKLFQAAFTAVALTLGACEKNNETPLPETNTSALVDKALEPVPNGNESALIEKFNAATDNGDQINLLYKIHDQALLKKIVTDSSRPDDVRAAALFNITDQDFLLKIARDESSPLSMRIAAVAQLTDIEELKRIAAGSDEQLAEAAKRRLEQILGE